MEESADEELEQVVDDQHSDGDDGSHHNDDDGLPPDLRPRRPTDAGPLGLDTLEIADDVAEVTSGLSGVGFVFFLAAGGIVIMLLNRGHVGHWELLELMAILLL